MLSPKNKADLIGTLNPKAWDAVYPHGPSFINDYLVELFVADAVKTASASFADKNLKKRGLALSIKMATRAAQGMLASWEPGDDICPPWPFPKKWRPVPFPPKGWWPPLGPDPVPPFDLKGITLAENVSALLTLSSLTMEKDFNAEIKGLAVQGAKGISAAFADEVERCGTVPRKHWGGPGPRPGGIKATRLRELVGG